MIVKMRAIKWYISVIAMGTSDFSVYWRKTISLASSHCCVKNKFSVSWSWTLKIVPNEVSCFIASITKLWRMKRELVTRVFPGDAIKVSGAICEIASTADFITIAWPTHNAFHSTSLSHTPKRLFAPTSACDCSSFLFCCLSLWTFSCYFVIYGAVSIRLDRWKLARQCLCLRLILQQTKRMQRERERQNTSAQFEVISGNFVSNIISFCRFYEKQKNKKKSWSYYEHNRCKTRMDVHACMWGLAGQGKAIDNRQRLSCFCLQHHINWNFLMHCWLEHDFFSSQNYSENLEILIREASNFSFVEGFVSYLFCRPLNDD